jgi:hypothetical protein
MATNADEETASAFFFFKGGVRKKAQVCLRDPPVSERETVFVVFEERKRGRGGSAVADT